MPLNIPPLEWPKIYNMVNLGGIDLATANGSAVPGIYQKITAALTSDHIEVFYNWKFADIVLPPSKVVIDVSVTNQYTINEEILVKSDDTVGIIGFIRIPIIVPLTAEENAVYDIPIGADGFGPVTVQVPIPTPTLVSLNADENGTYTPETGVDGFDEVVVNVPGPVLVQLTATENGTYLPGTGEDGFSSAVVNIPPVVPVTVPLSVTENGTYTPAQGVDGFSSVTVNVPSPPSLLVDVLHYNLQNGYIGNGRWYCAYEPNVYVDIFQVQQGHTYICALGSTVGNRFRTTFFTADPATFTNDTNGTLIGTDESNPAPYSVKKAFSPSSNGYIAIQKTSDGNANLISYLIDINKLS